MFNTVFKDAKNIANTIVLVVKLHIYRARCLKQQPNIPQIREEIYHTYKMELLGAGIKRRTRYCKEKWERLLLFLND